MNKTYVILFTLLCLSSLATAEPGAIKVLLISGQNNHGSWPQVEAEYLKILKELGSFEVEVTRSIEKISPARIKTFDVILSNWNNFGKKATEKDWPQALKDAYVDAVRNGVGHVVLHAGSSSFRDWGDYQKICLGTWGKGTSHGPKHEFDVRIDNTNHPITRGIKTYRKYDELWNRVSVQPDAKILASSYSSSKYRGKDTWEPNLLVGQFGKGRTAYSSFAHDEKCMVRPETRAILARMVEWAATGKTTIPAP